RRPRDLARRRRRHVPLGSRGRADRDPRQGTRPALRRGRRLVRRSRSLMEDVEAFLHHQQTVRNLSPNTLRAYAGDLVELSRTLEEKGPCPIEDVDLLALRRHLSTLQARGLDPRSVARKISSLRALFRWCLVEGRIAT